MVKSVTGIVRQVYQLHFKETTRILLYILWSVPVYRLCAGMLDLKFKLHDDILSG